MLFANEQTEQNRYNYRVLALDPGGTTGWACYTALRVVDGSIFRYHDALWTCGEVGPDDHHKTLFDLLDEARYNRYGHRVNLSVVYESFEFRQGQQRQNLNLMSKEYIGVIRLFGELYSGERTRVHMAAQTASQGKGFVDDKKLKVMDLYIPGKKHARDATRHLVSYLVNKERRHDLIESWRNL